MLQFLLIIFRFNVNDELAFPLLLRGLSHSTTWTKLTFSEMIKESQSAEIVQPQVSHSCCLILLHVCLMRILNQNPSNLIDLNLCSLHLQVHLLIDKTDLKSEPFKLSFTTDGQC
jgi:hypothetical protein